MVNEKINKIIANILIQDGAFSAAEIENKSDYSRSLINKVLHHLVAGEILLMSAHAGPDVNYVLAQNENALRFLFKASDKNEQMMIDNLARAWGVSLQLAKIKMRPYIDSGLIIKHGLPPKKIVYELIDVYDEVFSSEQKEIIEKYYAYVTPEGRFLKGVRGFYYWFKHKSGRQDLHALAEEYLKTRRQYYDNKERVFIIDATEKIFQVFGENTKLSQLFHRDFEALPVFSKTYLSRMVAIAKAGRANLVVMNYIVNSIQASIDYIIAEHKIDALAFIPPTVSRRVQLLDFIAKKLKFNLPVIALNKKIGFVPVQQKSLKKIEDRIINARNTIEIAASKHYNTVLLIDDVTGSGATLNETATKLIDRGFANKVLAFTITGSAKAKDFEVISEA